jgi:hypothetical protein
MDAELLGDGRVRVTCIDLRADELGQFERRQPWRFWFSATWG